MKVLTVHEKDSFKITRIFHHSCVSWSPFGHIVVGAGKDAEVLLPTQEDISTIMRERVISGYSLENYVQNASLLAKDSPLLSNLWNWIYSMKHIRFT